MNTAVKLDKNVQYRQMTLEESFRHWLGEEFDAKYFVTLTAHKTQSKHKEVFRKMVDRFIRILNRRLYQRQFDKHSRSLHVYYVLEQHIDETFHCHVVIGKLTGGEYLKGKGFEQVIQDSWNSDINHRNGFGICYITNVFDGSRLHDYLKKQQWRFSSDNFYFPV